MNIYDIQQFLIRNAQPLTALILGMAGGFMLLQAQHAGLLLP